MTELIREAYVRSGSEIRDHPPLYGLPVAKAMGTAVAPVREIGSDHLEFESRNRLLRRWIRFGDHRERNVDAGKTFLCRFEQRIQPRQ